VNFPKSRTTRTATAVGIAGISALMIFGPGSTVAADAARRIGSAAIKNNAVRSIDIRNETIRGNDVKDGSLTAKDFSGTLRGAPGPRGPAGPTGATGSSGSAATISDWRIIRASPTPSGVVNTTSDDVVPAETQVEAVKLAVNGDFQNCVTAEIEVRAGNGQLLGSTFWSEGAWSPPRFEGGGFIMGAPTPLTFIAACRSSSSSFIPLPAFTATVTLALAERDTTATSSFD
jgi:hypothetical protein